MKNFFCLSPGGRLALLALPLAGLLASPARAQQITLGAPVTYNTGPSYLALGFAVADVNNDGILDLISTNSDNRSAVAVQLGTGTGTFGTATLYDTGANSFPLDVKVADVNRDGLPDLVTANYDSNTAGVLLGKSAASGGGFQPVQQYATEPQTQYQSSPTAIAVADVNGDGLPDLVAANRGTNTLGVLLGKSAANGGGFQPVQVYPTSSGGSLPSDVKVADVNGDGLPDLITALSNRGDIGVLLGKSAASGGGFQPVQYYNLGHFDAYPYTVTVVDVNADGLLDLVAPITNYNEVGVLLGKSAASGGGFQTVQIYTTINRQIGDVTVGDLNSDGLLDLVISDGVLLGKSAANGGGFQPIQFFTSNGGGGGKSGRVRVADLNGDGRPDLITSGVTVRLNTTGLPTLNSLSVLGGPAGTSLTLTGTYLGTATAVSLNGQAVPFTVVNATTITAIVPAGSTTGNVVVTTPTGASNGLLFTITLPDLVISTATTIPAGAYNNITVTGTGTATLAGDVTVVVSATVQSGGTFYDNCYVLSGSGSFSLGADATLGICNPAGIGSGATGAIQVTGGRGFFYDANYAYIGTTAQSTGTGLPFQVRSLTTTNPAGLTLSAPTSVTQTLTIGGAGDLVTAGNALTLLSNANGTALVVNSGTGVVSGAATVQRYVDPSRNPVTTLNPLGLGYRHYAAPVSNTTVADLAAANFSGAFRPVVNTSYNTSANPTFVAPFPTVFGYDQALVSRTTALPTFDKGFFSPAALTDALVPGRGYAVSIGGRQVVDFVGTLGNGDLTVPLSRNAAGTPGAADAGWALLGNPYPAPLDYSRVAAADRAGLEAAIYIYTSTSQYQGQYRSYVNGIGNPVLPLGQGFFTRVASGQTSGALTFRNSQRLTAPNSTAFQRPTADPRPQVQLALSGAGLSDAFVAYAEAGATSAFDAAFDALKLPNPTGLNLSSVATSGENLAIDARPAFTAATVLPLAVGVPAAGSYSLTAVDLANLPAGLTAYLADDLTGQLVLLGPGTSYAFSVTTAQAASLVTGRFRLLFRPATALATAPALSAERVSIYPNPAHARFTVVLPGLSQATTVQAELLNSLGQVVRQQAAALPATGTQLSLDAAGLAAGVYTLRLQAGTTTLAKRLVVQ